MQIPELGVGLIYASGFENVLESNLDLIHCIEIEPQTFWYKSKSGLDSYIFDEKKINYLNSFKLPTLFHGVGFPVAGSLSPEQEHIQYLQKMISSLNPAWMSEHLSFNRFLLEGKSYNTNFLLPPLQSPEGIETACRGIKEYSKNFDLPFAFETGVNYLSAYPFEIEDGTFVNQIACKSGAQILLDLHNLLANHKNGRQNIYEFLDQIDPRRVVQIHLAGGFTFEGYYLDAHSGISGQEVMDIFEYAVKRLPELKAVTFEMLPEYLPKVSEKSLRKQFEKMNAVWDKRGTINYKPLRVKQTIKPKPNTPTVAQWENTLGRLVCEKALDKDCRLHELLKNDAGLSVIKKLIHNFKGAQLVSSLRMTCRYLMLKFGLDVFDSVLKDFWQNSRPQLFASENGLEFASYLLSSSELPENDRILRDLILYEQSTLLTILDDKERQVELCFNPYDLIPCLGRRELPEQLHLGKFVIKIEPDLNLKKEKINTVYHM